MSTAIRKYFEETGLLSQGLPSFFPRPQQISAAAAVEAAMTTRGGVTLIEAGTGVGKTLAYLIPALRRASRSEKSSSPPIPWRCRANSPRRTSR